MRHIGKNNPNETYTMIHSTLTITMQERDLEVIGDSLLKIVENGGKIIKRLLNETEGSHTDPYLELLNYRTLPFKHELLPAESLSDRKVRDKKCLSWLGAMRNRTFTTSRQDTCALW